MSSYNSLRNTANGVNNILHTNGKAEVDNPHLTVNLRLPAKTQTTSTLPKPTVEQTITFITLILRNLHSVTWESLLNFIHTASEAFIIKVNTTYFGTLRLFLFTPLDTCDSLNLSSVILLFSSRRVHLLLIKLLGRR